MASKPVSATTDLRELLSLETSILRVLCVTVNSEGELKYKILDTLSEELFYFPLTKSIFAAVTESHRNGEFVASAPLEQLLRRRSVELPDNFHLEDLFTGNLPSSSELAEWLARLKGDGCSTTPMDDSEAVLKRAERTQPVIPPEAPSPVRTKSSAIQADPPPRPLPGLLTFDRRP